MAIVDEKFRPEEISEESSTSDDDSKHIKGCTNPETVFAVATSFSYFLASNFNKTELETLINIMGLIVSNLSAIITQMEICEGETVVSLPE